MRTITKILIIILIIFLILIGGILITRTRDKSPPVTDIPDIAKENPYIGNLPSVDVSNENPVQDSNEIIEIPNLIGENPDIGALDDTIISNEGIV